MKINDIFESADGDAKLLINFNSKIKRINELVVEFDEKIKFSNYDTVSAALKIYLKSLSAGSELLDLLVQNSSHKVKQRYSDLNNLINTV
jgi:hypothetical protein